MTWRLATQSASNSESVSGVRYPRPRVQKEVFMFFLKLLFPTERDVLYPGYI